MTSAPEEPGMADGGISREHLREATLQGVRWVALGRVVAEVAMVASAAALARLIPPAEFGTVAVALILNAVALAVAGQGFGSPLVQRPRVDREHLEVAALLSLLSGVMLSAVVYAGSPLLEPLLGQRTADVMRLASPVFLLASLGVVANARLQRGLEFRRTSMIELTAAIVGIVGTVSLAVAGLDAEALVLGALARTATSNFLLLLAAPLVRPRWHRRAAGDILGFGGSAAGASIAYAGFRNVDYAIVSAHLGAAQLGYYYRAYQLCFDYQEKVTAVMQRLAFPVLSRSTSLADLRALRYRIVRVHTVVLFPLLLLIVATAPALIPWFYGARWEQAVEPARILGLAALATPITAGLGALMMAAGHPRPLLVATWLVTAGYAAAVLVAAPHGIVAVSYTVLGVAAARFLLVHHFLMRRYVGITLRNLWEEAAPGLVSGLALLAVAGVTTELAMDRDLSNFMALLCAAALGGWAYLSVLHFGFPGAWGDLVLLLGRVAPRRRSAGSEA